MRVKNPDQHSEADVAERVREEKRRYQRAWRAKNPNKNKEYLQKYWTKKALERMKSEAEGN